MVKESSRVDIKCVDYSSNCDNCTLRLDELDVVTRVTQRLAQFDSLSGVEHRIDLSAASSASHSRRQLCGFFEVVAVLSKQFAVNSFTGDLQTEELSEQQTIGDFTGIYNYM